MGLEKFLDLITNQRIRLVRASLLSDQRELRLPLDRMEAKYYKDLPETDHDDDLQSDSYAELRNMRKRVADLKDRVYLNCWSIAQYESYALWKIYLGGAKAGIAIKSSVAALRKSIKENKGITAYISRVNYVHDDDEVELNGISDHYFINNKSVHYDYEKELRVYFLDAAELHKKASVSLLSLGPGSAVFFDLDPGILINEIFLSPFMTGGFRKTIEKVIKKVNPNIKAKIHNSAVRDS